MASQSQGIQQLLQAEKRAQDQLEEAKKRKAKRIRQAKEEAMVEADQYRMQRDREFRTKQAKAMGSQSHLADEMEARALEGITELTGSYRRGADSVLARLLGAVCEVRPRLHLNYRAANRAADGAAH